MGDALVAPAPSTPQLYALLSTTPEPQLCAPLLCVSVPDHATSHPSDLPPFPRCLTIPQGCPTLGTARVVCNRPYKGIPERRCHNVDCPVSLLLSPRRSRGH